MGKKFLHYLDAQKLYACKNCKAHLSSKSQLQSKDFWAGNGKAFLFSEVVNVFDGQCEERMLRTGLHSVCDIFCVNCKQRVGWKYNWAFEHDQKYKEGKAILERNLIDKLD